MIVGAVFSLLLGFFCFNICLIFFLIPCHTVLVLIVMTLFVFSIVLFCVVSFWFLVAPCSLFRVVPEGLSVAALSACCLWFSFLFFSFFVSLLVCTTLSSLKWAWVGPHSWVSNDKSALYKGLNKTGWDRVHSVRYERWLRIVSYYPSFIYLCSNLIYSSF